MEMSNTLKKQAMYALDERIIQLIIDGKEAEVATAYEAYLAVSGYHSMDCFKELAAIRGETRYIGLLHVS